MNKRILILGAGEAQLNLIKMAKNLGYFTIVCDTRPDMEGSKLADKYYQVNYMDKELVYKIAIDENIDGIISNSEPAMMSVSYVVDKLKLPGNSVESLEKLLSKEKFRVLQEETKVYCPKSFIVETEREAVDKSKQLKFPIIIKPSESSGSRGTTKILEYSKEKIREAFLNCQLFSRNKKVVIEEFVEMESLELIDADVFVVGDDIMWDAFHGCRRSEKRPMIPMTKILPPNTSDERKLKVKEEVNKLLRQAGVKLGQFNVETYFSKNGELFVVEINPRQAGNCIPHLIKEHTGIDFTKLLVSLAVDDKSYYEYLKSYERENNYITLQVVFSDKTGIYDGLFIDKEIKPFINWINEFYKKGDKVNKAISAEDLVAHVDLKFDNIDQQRKFTSDIEKFIYPVVIN